MVRRVAFDGWSQVTAFVCHATCSQKGRPQVRGLISVHLHAPCPYTVFLWRLCSERITVLLEPLHGSAI